MFLFSSHLNGCTLESISRPSLLITDSFNATYVQPRRKQRDEMLLSKSFSQDFIVVVCYLTATSIIVNCHFVPVVKELSNPDFYFTIKVLIHRGKMS